MNPESERKSTKDMVKYFILFLLVAILLNLDLQLEKPTTYSFSAAKTTHAAFGQCDATDKYMYFTYWGKDSRVEIYDNNAVFLGTLIFEDIRNGRMYIRCEQERLFVKLRNDNVYVFRGAEEMACLSDEEANALGYTDEWFKSAQSKLRVVGEYINVLDSEGTVLTQIAKPSSIIVRSSSGIWSWTSNSGAIVVLLMLFFVSLLLWLIKKRAISQR